MKLCVQGHVLPQAHGQEQGELCVSLIMNAVNETITETRVVVQSMPMAALPSSSSSVLHSTPSSQPVRLSPAHLCPRCSTTPPSTNVRNLSRRPDPDALVGVIYCSFQSQGSDVVAMALASGTAYAVAVAATVNIRFDYPVAVLPCSF